MHGPNKVVLHNSNLERVARDKHSSLLGPFVSYEENKVLRIGSRLLAASSLVDMIEIVSLGCRLGSKRMQ
jgi:hypothetical protein